MLSDIKQDSSHLRLLSPQRIMLGTFQDFSAGGGRKLYD